MSAPDEDEWCAIDLESKLNKKIDALQIILQQQHHLIQILSQEMKDLKEELHRTHQTASHDLSLRHDRTHELLEELKILKQRELNMMLREKIPIPFMSDRTLIGLGAFPKPTLLSPCFLGRRIDSQTSGTIAATASVRSPTPFSL